jgi:protocatechuate 3,4-dioxygenase beta subunit
MRPPHIHFRVVAPGFRSLTTQMYFEGEDLNAKDRILQDLSPAERKLLIVAFGPVPSDGDQLAGRFDIVIGPVASEGTTPGLD